MPFYCINETLNCLAFQSQTYNLLPNNVIGLKQHEQKDLISQFSDSGSDHLKSCAWCQKLFECFS